MRYDPANSPLVPFHTTAPGFIDGSDSPRDFLERCLAVIEKSEKAVKAFATLNIEAARLSADQSTKRYQAGEPVSSIDGMPIGLKDIIETRDMPTQMGSPIFDGWQSAGDAACVTALRNAGAVILGKTVTCEFAALFPGDTTNPHDPSRTPGGSSSGSAASVGAGMTPAALGTQALGSITRPSSYCGAYGFKPTLGAINRRGCHDHVTQSCLGTIGASLEDCWTVSDAIVTRVGGDVGYPGLYCSGPKLLEKKPDRIIQLETSGWADAETEAKSQLNAALSRLTDSGVEIVSRHNSPIIENFEQALTKTVPLIQTINAWEFRWPVTEFRERAADLLSPIMVERLAAAEQMTLDEYRNGLLERKHLSEVYDQLSHRADLCLLLGATGAAPIGISATGNPHINAPSSLLGVPAVSLPLFQIDGMPLGLQAMGFQHKDEALISYARWIETALAQR